MSKLQNGQKISKIIHQEYRILQKWPRAKTSSVTDLDQIMDHDRRSQEIVIVKRTRLVRKNDEAHRRDGVDPRGNGSGLKPTKS